MSDLLLSMEPVLLTFVSQDGNIVCINPRLIETVAPFNYMDKQTDTINEPLCSVTMTSGAIHVIRGFASGVGRIINAG